MKVIKRWSLSVFIFKLSEACGYEVSKLSKSVSFCPTLSSSLGPIRHKHDKEYSYKIKNMPSEFIKFFAKLLDSFEFHKNMRYNLPVVD